jgi:hypothetical protein
VIILFTIKVLVQMDTKSRTRFLRDREICKKKVPVRKHPDTSPIHPYNAIELKCLWKLETPEEFYFQRVRRDVEKLETSTMEKWYRQGCHLWVLALGVYRATRKFSLPAGFNSHIIPIPNQNREDVLVIAWWHKTLDDGGVLRDFIE